MIEYFDNYEIAQIDGYKFRRDKKTGYFLSSRKIDGRRKRLHVYVWEKEYGKVPKGYHVHHLDGNKKNNELDNLELLSKRRHAEIHGRELSDEERQRRRERIIKIGVPAAKAWHGTKDGFEWHSKHAKETMSKREPIKYICTYLKVNTYMVRSPITFALITVNLLIGGNRDLITSLKFAKDAVKSMYQTNIKKPNTVRIAKIEEDIHADVYNMEVDDNHNLAINGGLVVHNCMDETRYFVKTMKIAVPRKPYVSIM